MRRVVIISMLIGCRICLGQPETDFPAEVIKAANVDNCIVLSSYQDGDLELISKLAYNRDGTVHTESFPTSYYYSEDTMVQGFNTYVFHYDSLKRLEYVTAKTEFATPDLGLENYFNERFIYNQHGQVIVHLDYSNSLGKVVAFHYKNERLVSEVTTQYMQSIKKSYSYSNNGNTVTSVTYNHQGTLLDSIIEEVDSLKLTKAYTYYEYLPNAHIKKNPQYYLYQFDSKWKVQKIRHYYDGYESITTFSYNEKGLLERSEVRGVERSEFVYKYTFRKESDEN